MCNLYLMYYSPSEEDDFGVCADQQIPQLSSLFPEDSDVQIKDLQTWRHDHSSEFASPELPISYSNSIEENNTPEFVPTKMKKQGKVLRLVTPSVLNFGFGAKGFFIRAFS